MRALRVSNEEFLCDENANIKDAFSRLRYPPGMLLKLKRKEEEIWRRKEESVRRENDILVVPASKRTASISRLLAGIGLRIIHCSGKITKDIVGSSQQKSKKENSILYKIPCIGCSYAYIGETSTGIKKRIYEHKNNMRHHRTSNSLVVHAMDKGHLQDWNKVKILHTRLEKKLRKTVEEAYITTEETTNHRVGFVCLSPAATQLDITTAGRASEANQSALSIPQPVAV